MRQTVVSTGLAAAAAAAAVLLASLVAVAAESDNALKLADPQAYTKTVRPFIAKHCVACHGEDKQKGDLRLDNLAANFGSSTNAGVWIEVMDNLNLGEMPPEDKPRPEVHELRAVTSWIAAELRQAERQALSTGGRVLLRRMNRTEYINTIRDLMRVEFLPSEDPRELLPPDGTAEGFDKVSAALMLDPSLLDHYFTVAQRVAQKAIVDGPQPYETLTLRVDFGPDSKDNVAQELAKSITTVVRDNDIGIMHSKGIAMRRELHYADTKQRIPVEGRYRIRFRAAADPGASGKPVIMHVSQNHPLDSGEYHKDFVIDAPPDAPKVYEDVAIRDPKSNHWGIAFANGQEFGDANPVYWKVFRDGRDAGQKGDLRTVLRLEARKKLEGGHDNVSPKPIWADTSKLPKLYIDWFEIEGPLYEQWPPKSHEMLLFKGDASGSDVGYAREILTRFMPRAFRRPVSSEEVEPYVELVKGELERGASFNDAVRLGVSAVLASPAFLYIYEPSAETTKGSRSLNGYELASRLSYFLWSSMPDEELFELAKSGKLSDAKVLEQQVDRMLADKKAEAFVRGFGGQWLRTDEFRKFAPDEKLYPDYTPQLGQAMVDEALSFFRETLTGDRPVHDFIDSDWTMLNETLAKFYGVKGVKGDQMRPVKLPADSRRGGLLGMAGVAMWGSDGNRTKPVSRAVYVREVLFNDPPDPPPPNAGEIEPNIKGENLTVRERLIQHQQIESCAACHRGLDPYGIALENFNVIGQWRTHQDGEDFRRDTPPINPSGKLPNGQAFSTFDEYKSLLLAQRDRLAMGLSEKMIVYALGRPVEPTDRSLVDALTKTMADHGYTMRSMIKELVTSDAFTTK